MLFRNYEYFIAIADAGSLTKAAERLYVSQSSLSQYLKRLEKRLGGELFDHTASPHKKLWSRAVWLWTKVAFWVRYYLRAS